MKNLKMITVCFLVILSTSSVAVASSASNINNEITSVSDIKTEKFKIYGNCGMCKKTIEGSLDNVKGIKKADWDTETKIMEVTYDSKKITLEEIKQKIASVGYDTDEVRAKDKVYNSLPGCCQYERPAAKAKHHEGHKH